jgi:ribonuclease P protein component
LTFVKRASNKNINTVKQLGLDKTERLKGKQIIKKLFSTGRRFYTSNLTIIYLPSDKNATGFVASKRIGGAVKRNRVKRILREAYRMNKDNFKGLKVIFYARGPLKFNEVVDIFKTFQEGK